MHSRNKRTKLSISSSYSAILVFLFELLYGRSLILFIRSLEITRTLTVYMQP